MPPFLFALPDGRPGASNKVEVEQKNFFHAAQDSVDSCSHSNFFVRCGGSRGWSRREWKVSGKSPLLQKETSPPTACLPFYFCCRTGGGVKLNGSEAETSPQYGSRLYCLPLPAHFVLVVEWGEGGGRQTKWKLSGRFSSKEHRILPPSACFPLCVCSQKGRAPEEILG